MSVHIGKLDDVFGVLQVGLVDWQFPPIGFGFLHLGLFATASALIAPPLPLKILQLLVASSICSGE